MSEEQQTDAVDEERYELTPEEQERRERALEQITQLGDPVLRTTAAPITEFGGDLVSLGAHMVALMDDAFGVGLAAPQIGKPIRLFVYRVDGDGDARAVVNPTVEPITEETDVAERAASRSSACMFRWSGPSPCACAASTSTARRSTRRSTASRRGSCSTSTTTLEGVLILERTTPEARRDALRELQGAPAPDSSEPVA